MKKLLFLLLLGLFASGAAVVSAQPRPADKTEAKPAVAASAKPAPATVQARYEGGIFGYNEKEKGQLKFDDMNERLVFFDKNNRELFSIPYKAMLVISPSTRKVQSGTGRTISAIPVMGAGIGGSFLKKKKNYMVIQFRDPDVDVQGVASFLLDTTELLESVIQTLGTKAELKARGSAFYRPTPPRKTEL